MFVKNGHLSIGPGLVEISVLFTEYVQRLMMDDH